MASHKWAFTARFRANSYGWRASALAIRRLKEAVREIKTVAKANPVLAADGAVVLMERLWPALQGIDSSSGSLGTAVARTLDELIPVLIAAPADQKTRAKWLDRLYEAIADDGVQYLSPVEDCWGEICVCPELVGAWAERLVQFVRQSWSQHNPGGWTIGATICLSCLLESKRYSELEELLALRQFKFWHFDKFQAEALARQGRIDEAIALASARLADGSYDNLAVVRFCERTLLAANRREEAYRRFGLAAATATTNAATFKNVLRAYPEKDPRQILVDLIGRRDKGKWFAAAKDGGFLDIALECAQTTTADPNTLTRAARDFTEQNPDFAAQVALCAIKNYLAGGGYEPTGLDIACAHGHLMTAAAAAGRTDWANAELQTLVSKGAAEGRRFLLDALKTFMKIGPTRMAELRDRINHIAARKSTT